MRRLLIISFTILFFSVSLQAQMSKEGRDKIHALKIAFLTEQISLTTAEAEKFWPIYNDYNKTQNEIRINYRTALRNSVHKNDIDGLDEKEAKKLIDFKLQTDKELYETQIKFLKNVAGVISYKKIIKLQIAEREFGRKLMRKYKHK